MTELTQEPQKVESAPASSASRAALAFIFATVLFDTLGFGIIIPVLPGLVVSFVGGDTAQGAEVFGLFGTVWALMQFLFAPLLGALSDRYGRRPVLILSAFGLGIDYIIMALAPNLTWLFIGRVVSGITSASFTVSFAYVADTVPGEKRAGAYGMIGSIFGVGFIIGPLVGGLLAGIGPRFPFWGAAALSLASAAYGLIVLPESLPLAHRSPVSFRKANPIGSLSMIRAHRIRPTRVAGPDDSASNPIRTRTTARHQRKPHGTHRCHRTHTLHTDIRILHRKPSTLQSPRRALLTLSNLDDRLSHPNGKDHQC